jgi:Cu(I)/Ag(I) efflux system membrane fusion protein
MKKTLYIILVVIILAAGFLVYLKFFRSTGGVSVTGVVRTKDLYYCPMHPAFTSDKPGDCLICGMSLVKREAAQPPPTGQAKNVRGSDKKKILYYRNPMNPAVTSPVPMKDEMGMDYVPVYEQEATPTHAGFYISPQKQQLIGVKKGKVELRRLIGRISTVGTVAYDPSLFVAQQEYLQTLKAGKTIADSSLAYQLQQSDQLTQTAKRKLLQMGMSESEIEKLAAAGSPEQSLYLPEGNKIWVYLVIYEYEAGLVKDGQKVEVEAEAYPGETFEGSVISVAPILDPMTRSLKVRCLVDNPENKLKLEMYVNVKIEYDLGEKLAVPQEAVMHTGTSDIVFVADPNGYFESRVVTLGARAADYYQVLAGLSPNEEVVTSGNFLIDSESKLNAVLSQMGEPNK